MLAVHVKSDAGKTQEQWINVRFRRTRRGSIAFESYLRPFSHGVRRSAWAWGVQHSALREGRSWLEILGASYTWPVS